MPSSNKTIRKLLNIFSGGDGFVWDDYNADILKIDAGLTNPPLSYRLFSLAGVTITTNTATKIKFDKSLNVYGGDATSAAGEHYTDTYYYGIKVPAGYSTANISVGIGLNGTSARMQIVPSRGVWNGLSYGFDFLAPQVITSLNGETGATNSYCGPVNEGDVIVVDFKCQSESATLITGGSISSIQMSVTLT